MVDMATKPASVYMKHKPATATQQRVIDALVKLGDGWHSAKDIARELGRDTLYGSDRGVIVRLLDDGILELRQQPASDTALLNRYEYRVIGKLPGAAE